MMLTEFQASRRQVLIGLASALGCWAIIGAAYLAGAFQVFDLRLLDLRFRIRGERPASQAIALVVIDDPTIRAYAGWPLPRDQYALLIQALEDAGARAIGIDLQFPEDTNHDPKHDALLAYVSRHGNVVHAVSFVAEPPVHGGVPLLPAASLEALRRQGIAGSLAAAPTAAAVSLPYPELIESAAVVGHITVTADRDGAIRRQPPLVQFRDRLYPSMALRMAGIGGGHVGPPRAYPMPGGVRVGWDSGATWRLALDAEGAASLDFAGDRRSFPQRYSMIEVLRKYQAGDTTTLRDQFAGRYVVVGLDSRAEVTEDVGTTPFEATTPLVFIHANAIDNFLRGRFLTRPSPWSYLAVLALATSAMAWGFATLPMTVAALVAAGAVALTIILDVALLSLWGYDAPPVAALLISPVAYAVVTSSRYLFLESRSRRRELDIREGRSVEQQLLPEALIGHDLSRYRVIERIGSGGMGVVYRGRDTRLNRDVAIKVLPARALADEKSRRRFRREALALSRLNHPHIASIYDFDSQDGIDFLVLEFVEGVALAERVKRGPVPESEIVRIMSEVTDALVEAHAHGMIHRDLKPENVMLTRTGEAKVLDFGVALFLDAESSSASRSPSLTEAGSVVGTLPYMAPEMLRGERAERRSDLYSLGVVAYEMATGKRPFPSDEPHELMYTILNQSPAEPRILNGRISIELESMILQLMEKEPADRFGSAEELLSALRSFGLPGAGIAAALKGAGQSGVPRA